MSIFLTWLYNRIRQSKEPELIRLTEQGFEVVRGNASIVSIAWTEIQRIVGYKRDLMTTDVICFAFYLSDIGENSNFEINEEMKGFEELAKKLRTIFPTFDGDWWNKVAKPAFALESHSPI